MIKPAIVAVGYNRPDGIRRLLESIGKAHFFDKDIPLIISIDESDKSNEVEKVAQEFNWEHGTKQIIRFPERQGLKKHIVKCGDLSEKYGAVIILEDDLVVAKDFYDYVCSAHKKYSDDDRICGVSLYSYNTNVFTHYPFLPERNEYDVYLGGMVVTWGQSWTNKQWKNFKKWYLDHTDKLPQVNDKIPQVISSWTRSWGRYFVSYMAENGLYYIYPYVSRTTCFSDFGEHNSKTTVPFTFVQTPLMYGVPKEYKMGDIDSLVCYDAFYERVLGKDAVIAGISGDKICFDLNNMKTVSGGKEYVVTNSKLPYDVVASFGMTLRPICENVIEGVPGNQIYLYSLKDNSYHIRDWNKRRPKYHADLRRLKYEFYDLPWRKLLYYTPMELLTKAKDLIKR